jgi:hypothetical protein
MQAIAAIVRRTNGASLRAAMLVIRKECIWTVTSVKPIVKGGEKKRENSQAIRTIATAIEPLDTNRLL